MEGIGQRHHSRAPKLRCFHTGNASSLPAEHPLRCLVSHCLRSHTERQTQDELVTSSAIITCGVLWIQNKGTKKKCNVWWAEFLLIWSVPKRRILNRNWCGNVWLDHQSRNSLIGMFWIFCQFMCSLSWQEVLSMEVPVILMCSRLWGSTGRSSILLQWLISNFCREVRCFILSGKASQLHREMQSLRIRMKNSLSSGIVSNRVHL